MAEPLGTIASVLTLAEVAASGARSLWGFINDIRTAPKQLRDLKEDILSAQQVLDGFRSSFEETTRADYSSSLVPLLHRFGLIDAIDANKKIILDFTATIERYTSHSKDGDLSKRDRLTVTFRKSKLDAFKARLDASKNTISYAATAATLLSSTLKTDDIKTKLQAYQAVLEDHSRNLNRLLEDMNDLAPPETEDPEEDNIPITAAERDLTLDVLPILQNTTNRVSQAIDNQITGTFQEIQSMVADTNSAAYAGTIGQDINTGVLRQHVRKAEAKNSSRIFMGKMSEEASAHFWSGQGPAQAWMKSTPRGVSSAAPRAN